MWILLLMILLGVVMSILTSGNAWQTVIKLLNTNLPNKTVTKDLKWRPWLICHVRHLIVVVLWTQEWKRIMLFSSSKHNLKLSLFSLQKFKESKAIYWTIPKDSITLLSGSLKHFWKDFVIYYTIYIDGLFHGILSYYLYINFPNWV